MFIKLNYHDYIKTYNLLVWWGTKLLTIDTNICLHVCTPCTNLWQGVLDTNLWQGVLDTNLWQGVLDTNCWQQTMYIYFRNACC
jgi:hypothetical protein